MSSQSTQRKATSTIRIFLILFNLENLWIKKLRIILFASLRLPCQGVAPRTCGAKTDAGDKNRANHLLALLTLSEAVVKKNTEQNPLSFLGLQGQ